VGLIACVVVTTTTTGTTPGSTSTPLSTTVPTTPSTTSSTAPPTTSGTTVLPTTVQTTTICKKDMAVVGGPYVSSVVYTVSPVSGTSVDLTSNTGNGITFPSVPNTTGLFDQNNRPVYNITITFNPAGADSLGSVMVNPGSNVNKFSIQFFVPSYPNQPFTFAPEFPSNPLYYNSTISNNSLPSISSFPPQVPSPLSGILISVLSTTNTK